MIAVCFLTADRYRYTETTLRTFAAHNDLSQFRLFHADDASDDRRVPALAQSYGFTTVAQSLKRSGWLTMRHALFSYAVTRASWVLFLENDIEWIRSFPWALFDYIARQSNIYCLRLYGQFKDRGTEPCMTVHKRGDRTTPVKWKALKFAPEPSQVGLIHWSAQPSVTRAKHLLAIHGAGGEPPLLTARVIDNVTVHIGAQRTIGPAVPEASCPAR